MFNEQILILTANQLKKHAKKSKDNQKHAQSTYNDYKRTIKLSKNETKV